MIKFENTEVLGWEHAIRGMRNPMNSWEKSDSNWRYVYEEGIVDGECIGPNDLDLMMRLRNAGADHRKFMRMITVYVDITAPLYWWKEFDTYKVGTVANSCSTMHKIHEKEFTLEDFSTEHLNVDSLKNLDSTIAELNRNRHIYINGFKGVPGDNSRDVQPKCKTYWWQMIQLLPTSYNQRRTIMLNYEVLANIYKSRNNHKLDEWRDLCDWIETLPYSELITNIENKKEKEND